MRIRSKINSFVSCAHLLALCMQLAFNESQAVETANKSKNLTSRWTIKSQDEQQFTLMKTIRPNQVPKTIYSLTFVRGQRELRGSTVPTEIWNKWQNQITSAASRFPASSKCPHYLLLESASMDNKTISKRICVGMLTISEKKELETLVKDFKNYLYD